MCNPECEYYLGADGYCRLNFDQCDIIWDCPNKQGTRDYNNDLVGFLLRKRLTPKEEYHGIHR